MLKGIDIGLQLEGNALTYDKLKFFGKGVERFVIIH